MEYKYQIFDSDILTPEQESVKSNSHGGFMLAICLAATLFTLVLTGCSDANGNRSFRSGDEAVREYQEFLSGLRGKDNTSIQTLAKVVNEWRVLDDSVKLCLSRDTVSPSRAHIDAAYRAAKDSIRIELCRMAVSRQRSYHDLLFLREQTSPYCRDKEILQEARAAQPFYDMIDSLPVNDKGGSKMVVMRYRNFLQQSVNGGINSKENLLTFIKEEHTHFKAFIRYLPELAGNDMADITRNTEQCCVQILHAADNKYISHKDAMIYLAMRTNMRLLRNAQMAVADIRSGKVKSEDTAHAHLWMLVQPFMSMDDFSVAVLSEKDKSDLYKVADALPKEMANLAKTLRLDSKHLSEMPSLMMKIYITRL